MNIVNRLEKLRLKLGFTWDQLGEKLELSRSMLHYVRNGERDLSDLALNRLEKAEDEAGLAKHYELRDVFDAAAKIAEKTPGTFEDKQVTFTQLTDKIGELMQSGVTANEIMRRLETSLNYADTPSSTAAGASSRLLKKVAASVRHRGSK